MKAIAILILLVVVCQAVPKSAQIQDSVTKNYLPAPTSILLSLGATYQFTPAANGLFTISNGNSFLSAGDHAFYNNGPADSVWNQFRVQQQADGSYTIFSPYSGEYLSVYSPAFGVFRASYSTQFHTWNLVQ
eukprot:Phypoly_transcript_22361.p1 GENE.Phypoly_transcript_22361~~Phypoly_transcript_22361.p1  ORF type:complete len:132 (+),score=16.60 Phypoly_transcript_22361:171-566(+)